MTRPDLKPLFDMLRSAPRAASIAEQRTILDTFAPMMNANPPAVGRVESARR